MDKTHACTGWWAQRGLGRQEMDGLRVSVTGDRVTGSGIDVVGAFTLDGRLEGGRVILRKTYMGQYDVRYTGRFDGQQRLWGTWHLLADRGPWEILIRRGDAEGLAETVEADRAAPHAL